MDLYGDREIVRWLSPAMGEVTSVADMRKLVQEWIDEDSAAVPPIGRWVIEHRDDRRFLGAAVLLPLPPDSEDFEMGWQLRRAEWGHGYATEAGAALARWAFSNGVAEIFVVARPANARAVATARRVGMEWVGETEKYYNLRLQVFRLRAADLDPSAPNPRTGSTA